MAAEGVGLRLHELSFNDLMEWGSVRREENDRTRDMSHRGRYGAVDVVESLLDAINSLDLLVERLLHEEGGLSIPSHERALAMKLLLSGLLACLEFSQDLDKTLPESVCTDEKGGERVWWDNRKKAEANQSM